MRAALIVFALMLLAPNAGSRHTSDLFILNSASGNQTGTPALYFSYYHSGASTGKTGMGARFQRPYTILSITASCSNSTGDGWYSAIYDWANAEVVAVGPLVTENNAPLTLTMNVQGEAFDQITAYWIKLGSATAPGRCRQTVIGAWR